MCGNSGEVRVCWHYKRREWLGIARLCVTLFMLLSLLVVVFGGNYPHEPIAPKFYHTRTDHTKDQRDSVTYPFGIMGYQSSNFLVSLEVLVGGGYINLPTTPVYQV